MAERTTTQTRLERLLYILPAAARQDGARLDELARALGVQPAEVLRDLEEATARAYYQPAGSVDSFEILIEGDRVRVWSPSEFKRPVRLSPHEALALGLGLRTLAAEAEEPRRAEILALASRLELELSPMLPDVGWGMTSRSVGSEADHSPDVAAEPSIGYEIELGEDGFRGVIAEAVQLRRRCRFVYLKPGAASPQEREVDPYTLVYAQGSWYVLGRDAERRAVRVFRMDRILEASLTDAVFDAPATFDPGEYLSAGGVPYRAEGGDHAVVRYSPRVAPRVAEALSREANADGTIEVRHDVSDPGWVVRHVLQYGGEAELVEPQDLRERVATAAVRKAEIAA